MKRVCWIACLMMCLLPLWSCAPSNTIKPMVNINDKQAFDTANQKNTIDAYRAYLVHFPNGQYFKLAYEAIDKLNQEKLQEVLKKESLEKEKTVFYRAESINNIAAYREYLQQYPQGHFADEAAELIKRLNEEELKRVERDEYVRDKSAFEQAEAENSINSYQKYQNQFPQGSFIDRANEQIKKINYKEKQEIAKKEMTIKDMDAFKQAKTEDTIKSYQAYLDRFPQGQFANTAKESIKSKMIREEEEGVKKDKIEKDKKAFEKARVAKTLESYQDYLKLFPQGQYAEEARDQITKINEKSEKPKTLKEFMDELISPIKK